MGAGVIGVGYSSCNQPPIKGGESSETAHPNKKNDCASPYSIFEVGLNSGWVFVHDHHEEIIAVGTVFIAVFTIVLGLFTVSLAGSTDKLVKGADKTAERQLRAYVFLDGIDLRKFNDAVPNISPWRFRIAWKNAGNTRARGLISKVSHDVVDLTQQPLETFAFQDEPDAQMFRGLIGPSQSVNPTPIPVIDLHLHSAGDGETALLIWGWAEYQDVFSETVHRTEFGFRVLIEGNILSNHIVRFEPTEKHNAADEDCMHPPQPRT
jgi:hypothetical protein